MGPKPALRQLATFEPNIWAPSSVTTVGHFWAHYLGPKPALRQLATFGPIIWAPSLRYASWPHLGPTFGPQPVLDRWPQPAFEPTTYR